MVTVTLLHETATKSYGKQHVPLQIRLTENSQCSKSFQTAG